jgi:HK97 gp10 family phage protein
MSNSTKVEGMDALIIKLHNLEGTSDEILGQSLLAGAFVLEGKLKQGFHGAKSGRIYKRGRKFHTASAPGQTPAIDYGALLSSIASQRSGNSAIVFTDKAYAPPLEFGTAKMAARPFMRPTLDKHREEIQKTVAASVRRLVDKVSK